MLLSVIVYTAPPFGLDASRVPTAAGPRPLCAICMRVRKSIGRATRPFLSSGSVWDKTPGGPCLPFSASGIRKQPTAVTTVQVHR